jgi:hypothetical protein
VTTFWLCREFGWTPHQVRQQNARDIERLVLILDEWQSLQEGYRAAGTGATTILVTED